MTKVYFAGPLFNEAEKYFNKELTKTLEEFKYEVFLPQRDGYEAAKLLELTEQEKAKIIFEKDISEIEKADVVFMVLDGRVPDDGACVELGYAYAKGKRCYGIKTDVRAIELNLEINPMISGCFVNIIQCLSSSAVVGLAEFLKNNKL